MLGFNLRATPLVWRAYTERYQRNHFCPPYGEHGSECEKQTRLRILFTCAIILSAAITSAPRKITEHVYNETRTRRDMLATNYRR
jgi:hypothetical protein